MLASRHFWQLPLLRTINIFFLNPIVTCVAPFLSFLSYKGFLQQEFDCSAASMTQRTPALSYDQDFKKGRNNRSMDSGPILHTDTGKYFKVITAKSEENGLCLKFNFTSSRVPQKILGVLQLPYLETRIFKNQKKHRTPMCGLFFIVPASWRIH